MIFRPIFWLIRLVATILIRAGVLLNSLVPKKEEHRPGEDPALKGTDHYWDGLFDVNAARSSYTAFVWGIRDQWLRDVTEAVQANPECIRCAVNKVTRRYEKLLIDHSSRS